MDVASWLRSIGLEQYEAVFRENAISEKVLPRLTAEDLKDLGVSIVGHRRVLLDAITDLRLRRPNRPHQKLLRQRQNPLKTQPPNAAKSR